MRFYEGKLAVVIEGCWVLTCAKSLLALRACLHHPGMRQSCLWYFFKDAWWGVLDVRHVHGRAPSYARTNINRECGGMSVRV